MIQRPVFLVGAERSGTTLLRLMLDNHPKIAMHSEFEYAVDEVSDDGTFPQLSYYYDWLTLNRIYQESEFFIDKCLNYKQLVNSFLLQKKENDNKIIVGATIHRHLNRIQLIWPDALFIHIVRDPRDVARSCTAIGWAGNVWTAIEPWMEVEYSWDEIAASLPNTRYIEITYENLVTNPREELRRICDFLRIEYDRSMLRYSEKTHYSYPDEKLKEQWRRKGTPKEIALVETKAGELLVKRKYELSGLPPINVTPVHESFLKISSRFGKVRFAIKRYGIILILQRYLSRKLGITSWQRFIQEKKNTIDMELNRLHISHK